MHAFEAFAEWLVDLVHGWGYFGLFCMTFLESTFVPIPAELTMIPAGYLAYQGHMNIFLVLIISVIGSLAGSLACYYLAYHYGRRFLYSYGKYFFFNHETMEKLDSFFAKHGEISTFTGRLVPGLRHFISFPAGLGRMHLGHFCFYTCIGASIWMGVLIMIGYYIGDNKEAVKRLTPYVTIIALGVVVGMIAWYVRKHRKSKKGSEHGNA